ncbi:MAG TPA: CehA/McbA family metallohydrolase [Thermoleophilaceae bacterium]|nr:CehA/McbA family metallohydrolase [Thermoleophilaceae bacterium]
MHDLVCVVHVHSTHSDGSGSVPQIARAAQRAGIDVVLLTDHDTLAAKREGEERWYENVLVLVGEEVSPTDRDHFLAFGIDQEISRRLTGPEICEAVNAAGGFGFAAHPFSRGSERFKRPGIVFGEPDCLEGIELWSFLNDTGERVRGFRDLARMILAPQRAIGGPPEGNLSEWDRLCQARRVVAIGGLDAHQFGIRIAGHVPLRLMGYRRAFKQLHTHVLVDEPLTRELEHDRTLVYEALRQGRCYIANDEVADARGFAVSNMGEELGFESGRELLITTPQRAHIRLLRDGERCAEADAPELRHSIELPGVYRVEVVLAGRPWIYSNPVYFRAYS